MSHTPTSSRSRKLDIKHVSVFLLTLIAPALIFLLRPMGLSLSQAGILAALVLTIIWWVTGAVERTIASLFLLAVFLIFSGTPVKTVLSFPLSENFLMIAVSFLFSQGVSNSGLISKLLQPVLERVARKLSGLIAFMLLTIFVMIFIIPQPFSRIILLSLIFADYFDKMQMEQSLRAVLMLGLYFFSVLMNMTVLRGDIILNSALLSMSGLAISEGQWMAYMALPTVVFLSLAVVLYCLVFRKTLGIYHTAATTGPSVRPALTKREKLDLAFLATVILLWATEGVHGISGTAIVIVASILMFPMGMLQFRDLKTINVKLLVFLTAAFAIGGTMAASGVADKIFSLLVPFFPQAFGLPYVLIATAVAIVLHMLLGSNITTMSVVVPGLLTIAAGVAPELPLSLTIFVAVCGQFILPFHHVVLLLGEGNGYYSLKDLSRLGIPHTVLTIAAIVLVYLPWWGILGLI